MLIILESHFDSFRMCRNPSLPGFLIRFARGAGASTGAALIEWHGGLTGWWLADDWLTILLVWFAVPWISSSWRRCCLNDKQLSQPVKRASPTLRCPNGRVVQRACLWQLDVLVSELSILICRFRCVYRAFFADPMQIEHSCHNLQKSTISITISMQSNLTAHWHLQFVSGLFYMWIVYFCWCHHLLVFLPFSCHAFCSAIFSQDVRVRLLDSQLVSCPPLLQAGDVFSAASCCLSLWKEHGQVAGAQSDKGYRVVKWEQICRSELFQQAAIVWIYFF